MYKGRFWFMLGVLVFRGVTGGKRSNPLKDIDLLNEYATKDTFEDASKPDVNTLDVSICTLLDNRIY